jgi:hypothetical protein
MKIGFFGDSFCADLTDRTGCDVGYETYISKLKNHYNAEISNLGVAGSSIYDSILLQIKPFIEKNDYPDVCIFVWTNYGRIFHRTQRNLALTTVQRLKADAVVKAAREYFIHLLDWELQQFQYKSALQYFDSNILPTFPRTTQILHMWAFEKLHDWNCGTVVEIPYYKYFINLASDGRIVPKYSIDPELNHLDGAKKNNIVFEAITQAIDNYEDISC